MVHQQGHHPAILLFIILLLLRRSDWIHPRGGLVDRIQEPLIVLLWNLILVLFRLGGRLESTHVALNTVLGLNAILVQRL